MAQVQEKVNVPAVFGASDMNPLKAKTVIRFEPRPPVEAAYLQEIPLITVRLSQINREEKRILERELKYIDIGLDLSDEDHDRMAALAKEENELEERRDFLRSEVNEFIYREVE